MSTSKRSTSVIRTGFTAARSASTAANPIGSPRKLLRVISRIDAILLDGIFVQIQAESWKLREQHIPVLNREHVGRPHKLQRRSPLLRRQIRFADHLLPLAI